MQNITAGSQYGLAIFLLISPCRNIKGPLYMFKLDTSNFSQPWPSYQGPLTGKLKILNEAQLVIWVIGYK